jgi:hypothetical protein
MIADTVKSIVALVVVIVIAIAGFTGWDRWRAGQRERRIAAEADAARMAAAVAEVRDSLADARQQLDAALGATRAALALEVAPHRRSRPGAVTASSVDTTPGPDSLRGMIRGQRRELDSLRRVEDSLIHRLSGLRDTLAHLTFASDRFRRLADATIAAQAREVSALRVVIATPRPRRRWGFGGAAGYCTVAGSSSGGPVARGAGLCVGVAFNF